MTAAEKLRQEGEMTKAIETAKKALAQGANIKFISEITGLSVKKVEELKKKSIHNSNRK